MLFFFDLLTVGQGGGRTDVDIGDTQGCGGTSQIEGAKIIDLKGELRIGTNIGYCGIDHKIRADPFEVITDIAGIPDGQFLAAWGPKLYRIGCVGLKVVGKGTTDKAGAADEDTEHFGRG